ncbi:sensor histidine kinase [Salinithrix halophila]|uniref:histidine kinase n=1 Tax=Salinithrix halophila TaxID=1485204 RepID=A0ABV8JDY0_9BACL
MKLFLREHLPLIGVFFIQFLVSGVILWFAGFQHLSILLYILLLNTSFLLGYFFYRYGAYRAFYRRLSRPLTSLEESIRRDDPTPLGEALNEVLESQYRHYKEKIHHYERKQRDQITFITQWVHQMKTPLSVIHLILEQEDDPQLDSIREEADRLGRGLETVLYTARLDVFDRDFHVETVRLYDLVQEVIQESKRLFIQNRVYPELRVKREVYVESDAKWLAFILKQLISNAVRYSSDSGEKVTVSSFFRGKNAVLEVRDRGVGIPKKDVERVFEPYYTGENGRIFSESTGMGLYLVRKVCRHLDHHVELESEPGEGTAVRIVFFSARTDLTTN